MREFIAITISFLIIPLLSKKNIPIGIAICICAIVMATIGGLGFPGFTDVIVDTFLDITKIQQYIIVIEISILGTLLKKYKIIDNVIAYLGKVVRSKRAALMSIPALVGLLAVPGGAIISVPFIDHIGEESNLPNTQKAIINLIYRHVSMHIMPYTTGFLLVTSLVPEISIYKLMGLNGIFVFFYCAIGYFLYINKIQDHKIPHMEPIFLNILNLLKYTLPVYLAVILNIFFGIPFYIGMLGNLIVVLLLHPTKTFFSDAIEGFNIKILLALIGVYLIQGVVSKMGSLTALLNLIFGNPNTTIIGIIITSFFFGMTTGFQPTALGIILPILATLPISNNRLLLYCHFTFVWSFMGYFFSPLHLCQLFTCEYLKVSVIDLYKEYKKFFLYLVMFLIINYFIMGMILN